MIKQRAIQTVGRAANPPERCIICHSDKENWYIDTGLDTTFDGTFYIGKCCVDKIVAHSPDHYNREQIARLLHENKTMREEAVAKMEQAYHELAIIKQKLIRIREALNE